jgi:GT2 family glycosyltransferase
MPTSAEESKDLHQLRILAVVVVYKMSPLQTPSFLSLLRAREAVLPGRLDLRIYLYDNSCDGADPGSMPEGVEYYAASRNEGLSQAYNQALRFALANGYEWLLTLDQDTSLPSTFLHQVTEIAGTVADDPSIAAIAPLISDGGANISPTWFFADALPRYYDKNTIGIGRPTTYAFNSAATLRVASLVKVGGYNPWFWLDYSDGYIFRQLQHHHLRVFVAGDIEVAHNFASTDMQNRVSLKRYRNMLLAETAFWDLEMGRAARWERTLGLARLALKHLLLKKMPEHRNITYEFLKRRLFWTKKSRLEAWKRETLEQFPMLSKMPAPPFV